ncbi:uncharacterized protein LOC111272747 isoform X2 [Varroa jacobsoni]|uniref:uncharacterized protein LOC111272747 isoform X2 n=1 Tax=Varroa jacobsoni TaxID=62625 RepID=UPI000BF61F59|nr:uncharacterized protein LOC111272747 isoform X2 [Varroa jacobsoni]XP_022710094.1 uncharacterized protein LOC111272747 isoform X2 [Varroa jacobsoni]
MLHLKAAMKHTVAFILASFVTTSTAGTPRSQLFACIELPTWLATGPTSYTVKMIERVLNVSGVFLATGARTTEEQSNFEPMDLHATITTQFPSAFENGSYLPSSYRLAAKLVSAAPRDTFVYQAKPSSNIIALDTSAIPNDVKMPPIILGQPGTPNPNLGLEFRNTLVKACKSAFPDISIRDLDATPFRYQNCSVVCVLGFPPVPIPDGEICYLQINSTTTLGRCRNKGCI